MKVAIQQTNDFKNYIVTTDDKREIGKWTQIMMILSSGQKVS